MNWRRNLIGSTVGRYDSREPRGVHVLMFARSLKKRPLFANDFERKGELQM